MKKWLLAAGALIAGGAIYAFSSVREWAKAVADSRGIGLWPGASGQPAYMDLIGGNGEAENILGPPDGKAAAIHGVAGNYIIVEMSAKPREASSLAVYFMWLYPGRDTAVGQTTGAQVSADGASWTEVDLDSSQLEPGGNLVRKAVIPGLPVRYVRLYQRGGVSCAIDAVAVQMRRM